MDFKQAGGSEMNLTATDFFAILAFIVFFSILCWQGMEIRKLKSEIERSHIQISKLEEYFTQHIQDCHKPGGEK